MMKQLAHKLAIAGVCIWLLGVVGYLAITLFQGP